MRSRRKATASTGRKRRRSQKRRGRQRRGGFLGAAARVLLHAVAPGAHSDDVDTVADEAIGIVERVKRS